MSSDNAIPAIEQDEHDFSAFGDMTEAFMPLARNQFDPIESLGRTRVEQPVRRLTFPFGITAWLISDYEQAKIVLGSIDEYSNNFDSLKNVVGEATAVTEDPGGLGMSDPPFHTRMRKALMPEFTMRRLQRLIPRIHEIVDQQLDILENAGQGADFLELVAMPIPSLVISELLDVPFPDREDFGKLSASRFDIFGGAGSGLDAVEQALVVIGDLVRSQRKNPGDGLLGALIREHGDDLTDAELAGLADGLIVGGHETTASMIALGTLLLSQAEPEARAALSDDAAIKRIVEEMLRYLTVVQLAFPRFAKQDMEIGGQQIAAGEMVLVSLSSANRDNHLGIDMDTFDWQRPATSHYAFGYGIHRCVGAELAKLELRIAYPKIFARFPNLQSAVPLGEVTFRDYSVVHGVDSLPVTW